MMWTDYDDKDGDAVNWGMKDIPFFEQSVSLNDRNASAFLFTFDYINEPLSF